MYMYMCVYIYIYMHTHTHLYIYIYILSLSLSISLSLYIYIYIYIYITLDSEKGEVLPRGFGSLRYLLILSESSARQAPICAVAAWWFDNPHQKWFLGAGFLGAPPNALIDGYMTYQVCGGLCGLTEGAVMPGQARPGQARPGQARPGQARPGQARPGQARPGQARPGQAMPSHPIPSHPIPSHPIPSPSNISSNQGAKYIPVYPYWSIHLSIYPSIHLSIYQPMASDLTWYCMTWSDMLQCSIHQSINPSIQHSLSICSFLSFCPVSHLPESSHATTKKRHTCRGYTVSSHDFNSQNLDLRVSNPISISEYRAHP